MSKRYRKMRCRAEERMLLFIQKSISESKDFYRIIADFPTYRVGRDGSVWRCYSNCNRYNNSHHGTPYWKKFKGTAIKSPNGKIHLRVCLHNGKRRCVIGIGPLVLRTFVGPPPIGMQACHWDDDALHNDLKNLRCGTRMDNKLDAVRNGCTARGERNRHAKLTRSEVMLIRGLHHKMTHDSLAKRFSVSSCAVGRILRKEAWAWL